MPKNSKPVVQTGDMVAMFNEQEIATINASATAFVDADADQAQAVQSIAKVLGAKPSWERYEAGRIRIFAVLKEIGKTEDAIKGIWKRMRDKLGITIPKSDNPEAQKKAEQRAKKAEEARKVYADMTDSALQTKVKELLANPTLANIASASKMQKEVELRFNEASKADAEELKKLRENLRDWIKTADYKQLQYAWHYVAGI
jgi:hypothetical protein